MSDFITTDFGQGLRLHVAPTKKFKTTTIKIFLSRPLDDKTTVAALLPNVLKRGTAKMPTAIEIEKQLESYYGARFGCSVRKIGEQHLLEFAIRVVSPVYISEDKDLLKKIFAFFNELLYQPLVIDAGFKAEYVAQEMNVLRQEIESTYNDKEDWAMKRCVEETCQGEAFAIPSYGRLEDLEQITPQTLYQFYQDLIQTAPLDVFVVGDVSSDEIVTLVKQTLLKERKTIHYPPKTDYRHQVKEIRQIFEDDEVNQGKLVMSMRTNVSPCDAQFPALLFYNSILGGGTHSKLFTQVREKNSLAYYAGSHLERTKGLIFISAGIDSEKVAEVIQIIRAQIEALKAGDISELEFIRAKTAILNSLQTIQDYSGGSIDHYLVGLVTGCCQSLAQTKAALLQVTLAEVIAVAQNIQLDTIYFLKRPQEAPNE